MARARNIKPGFFANEVLAELPPLARLLFAGLWTVCDRAGRAEDRPKRIKVDVLPYDDCDCDALLEMLHSKGFIRRYEVKGQRLIQVLTWDKHQNPHVKEAASSFPEPGEPGANPVLTSDKAQPLPERAGLIPSSLIPDSLISDSDAPAVASGAERAPSSRGSRLPNDWELPGEWLDWALAEHPHWGPQTVHGIAAKFGRYWRAKAGKDATKLDWLATWQNWCTSDITQREHPPPSGPTETAYQRSMRERMEQVAPAVAAKRPGSVPTMNPMDVLDGLTRISG